MKRILLILLVAVLLAGAFYLPDMILREQERRAAATVYYGEASPVSDSLTLYDKLNAVARIDYASLNSIGVEEDTTVFERYCEELDRPCKYRIIDEEMRDRLKTTSCTIYRMLLIDVEQEISLSLYEVDYFDFDSVVLVDAQSGLILKLSLPAAFAEESYAVIITGMLDDENFDGFDWGGYYGAESSNAYLFEDVLGLSSYCAYAERLTFAEGEVVLCQTFERMEKRVELMPKSTEYFQELLTKLEQALDPDFAEAAVIERSENQDST